MPCPPSWADIFSPPETTRLTVVFILSPREQGLMKILVETSRFGRLEINEEEILTVSGELIGLEGLRFFTLVDEPSTKPFRWLQSLEHPWIALPILSTHDLIFEYDLEIPYEELLEIGLKSTENAEIYIVATIPQVILHSHVNLRAPILFNPGTRLVRQVDLVDSGFPTKLYFFDVHPDEDEPANSVLEKICLN
jgi:flagellar assembly factor FliW